MSYCVLIIHLLGDTPSPYIVGLLTDWMKSSRGDYALHSALLLCYLWTVISIAFYSVAYVSYGRWVKPRLTYGRVP